MSKITQFPSIESNPVMANSMRFDMLVTYLPEEEPQLRHWLADHDFHDYSLRNADGQFTPFDPDKEFPSTGVHAIGVEYTKGRRLFSKGIRPYIAAAAVSSGVYKCTADEFFVLMSLIDQQFEKKCLEAFMKNPYFKE